MFQTSSSFPYTRILNSNMKITAVLVSLWANCASIGGLYGYSNFITFSLIFFFNWKKYNVINVNRAKWCLWCNLGRNTVHECWIILSNVADSNQIVGPTVRGTVQVEYIISYLNSMVPTWKFLVKPYNWVKRLRFIVVKYGSDPILSW